jgi:lipopolysaccharide export system ATP-binding protein
MDSVGSQNPAPDVTVTAPDSSGLVARKLRKAFGARTVVRDVSVRLGRGEVVGLLGPNGAGKTTCFYMITGLIKVDSGDIYIDGRNVTALPMYQRARLGVGYLPQEASIFRGMTVEENVASVVELVEKSPATRRERTDQLLEELHITRVRGARATTLSGGERRRVEIARALAARPDFILLDEPFAGIDPKAIDEIKGLIGLLKERGIGVLITDHNARVTLGIVDRGLIIADGQVLFEGTPDQIREDPDVRASYLGPTFDM